MPKEKAKREINLYHPAIWIVLAVLNFLIMLGVEYFIIYPIPMPDAVRQNLGNWVVREIGDTITYDYSVFENLDFFEGCRILDASDGSMRNDGVYVLYQTPEEEVKLIRLGKSVVFQRLNAHEEDAMTVTEEEFTVQLKHFLQTDTVTVSNWNRISQCSSTGPMWEHSVVYVYIGILICMFAVEALIIWAINRSRKKKKLT